MHTRQRLSAKVLSLLKMNFALSRLLHWVVTRIYDLNVL